MDWTSTFCPFREVREEGVVLSIRGLVKHISIRNQLLNALKCAPLTLSRPHYKFYISNHFGIERVNRRYQRFYIDLTRKIA